jgi:SAM-dependent methyltransferase
MHDFVMSQVKQWANKYGLGSPTYNILEIGSQDFNGSVRPYFATAKSYVGVDMTPGKGVDVVVNASELAWHFSNQDIHPKSFDVIICLEMLEHDAEFWVTMDNIRHLLRHGGILVLTARGCTKGKDGKNGESMWEHGYPYDYWRFMPQSVPLLMAMGGCNVLEQIEDEQHPGFLAIGQKL